MQPLLNPQNLFDIFIAIGGVAFAVAQFVNGKNVKKSGDETDALTTIKIKDLTIEALQKENADFKVSLKSQGERIAVLESDNKRLEAIVNNRNPELETFMKDTRNSIIIIEASLQTLLKLHQAPSGVTINNQPTV